MAETTKQLVLRYTGRALLLTTLLGFLLLLAGCGTPRLAQAQKTADASLAASEKVLSDPESANLEVPELSEEQAEKVGTVINRALMLIQGSRQMMAPVGHYLDPDGEVSPAMTAEDQLLVDRDTYQKMTEEISRAAQEEAESRVWWRRLITSWAKEAGAWSLSLLGLGGLAATAASGLAVARKWVKRGRQLAHTLGFGEEADRLLNRPEVPPELREEWGQTKSALKKKQEEDGVRTDIQKDLKRKTGKRKVAEAKAESED